MSKRSIHTVVKGATNTQLRAQLLDADREAVGLSELDEVSVLIRLPGGTIEADMEIEDADQGICTVRWDSTAHTAFRKGDHPMNIKVEHTDGSIDYFPAAKDGSLDREVYDILRVRLPI